jgi:hypothetical protein
MKKISIIAAAFAMSLNLMLPNSGNVQAAASFKDVPNDYWAKKEIAYLVDKAVITGYKDGNFKPNNHVTNAQVATMLVKALQLNTKDRPDPQLKDVPMTHHAYKEIATVIAEGIFPKSQTFNPELPITREAMARALTNAFKLEGMDRSNFVDVPSSYWAYPYIMKVSGNSIATGYLDGTFRPKSTVTRAQFSVFTARAVQTNFRPIKKQFDLPSTYTPFLYEKADLNNDGQAEIIRLVQMPASEEGSAENVYVLVEDLTNQKFYKTDVDVEVYEQTKLQVNDFNHDQLKDLFITSPSDENSETTNSWFFQISNDKLNGFHLPQDQPNYMARFSDGYQAHIANIETGKMFTVDLNDRKKEYEELGLYTAGKAPGTSAPSVQPFNSVTAVDMNQDGKWEIKTVQDFHGVSRADKVASAETVWTWQNGEWAIVDVMIKKAEKTGDIMPEPKPELPSVEPEVPEEEAKG